jgi:lysophospholipase L1-like esterase
MNSNRRVLLFVLSSVTLYLLFSFSAYLFGFQWMPFKRVNLIADVVKEEDVMPVITDSIQDTDPVTVDNKPSKDFKLYLGGRYITDFSTDSSRPSLNRILSRLAELKKGQKTKIRIAYFGDSMIEGDLMTQTIRELLQAEFGGSGVGFVPVTSLVSKFRQSAWANYSGGWEDESFKTKGNSRLYLSGHLFRGNGDWVEIRDQTIRDSSAIIEKSLICGASTRPVSITVNGGSFTVSAPNALNRVVLAKDRQASIRLQVSDPSLPVYGISFETASGVHLDNFSFRGITGIELARIDSNFLASIAENNSYDLIVFQYGVNLLFRPNDKNFSWYGKSLAPVIRKFRNCFPNSDILIVSTADRAFRYNGKYESAVGIDSLVKVQAALAYENGASFYNQYASMGGRNSIVEWASRNPSLANKDYVHPNHRGAELLGRYFFEAIMQEYRKYLKTVR